MKNKIIGSILLVTLFFFLQRTSYGQEKKRLTINSISIVDIRQKVTKKDSENNMVIAENEKYRIIYMPKYQNEFLISVLASPFPDIRKLAEKDLLKLLDISENDACWLNIVISTNYVANPDFAKDNYRPSFCEQKKNADINHDGMINTIDYALIITHYGLLGKNIKADVNNDGVVNALDLSIVLGKLGEKIQ